MSDTPLGSPDGRSASGSTDPCPTVTPDGAFEALADPLRRAVVSHLRDRPDESVAVETLAEWVVSHDAFESDPSRPRHAMTSLASVHLPKLDDCGLVEYDRDRRTVRYVDSPLVDGLLRRTENDAEG